MIIGRNYYEENQKLFSTGNEDLDTILEEVYYSGIEDGYDYAQKEFASARQVKKAIKMGTKNLAGIRQTTLPFSPERRTAVKKLQDNVLNSKPLQLANRTPKTAAAQKVNNSLEAYSERAAKKAGLKGTAGWRFLPDAAL